MTPTITFTVPGTPSGKGSMRAVSHAQTGKAVVMAANIKGLAAWTAEIKHFAWREWGGRAPTKEAVSVSADFFFLRPKSHFGTGKNAGVLKKAAPRHPTAKKNDLDKLVRALFDALTGMVFVDDGQVANLAATKRYAEVPRMEVVVTEERRQLTGA